MAGRIFDSIHAKLLTLPDDLEIFPGHAAGSVCGAGLSGKPSSTIGFELRHNRAFAMTDEAAFIRFMVDDIPPPPENAAANRAVNAGLMTKVAE